MDDTRRLKFITTDVFTTQAYGGNPLAVVLDGRGLSKAQMQKIANEFNLSETTFVLPPDTPAHAYRVKIFTPTVEMEFAGHPTVGTAWVLAALGKLPRAETETTAVLEENVGPVPIRVRWDSNTPTYVDFTTAKVPSVEPASSLKDFAAMLGLKPDDVDENGTPALSLSCGTWFTCIPLRTVDAVARARLNMDIWGKMLGGKPANKTYIFARTAADKIHARMFGPGEGVTEDPATGSAACAVTGWLARDQKLQNGTGQWTITQGVEMGRPSTIFAEADVANGSITAVRCGGTAVLISEGELRAPD
jgi:trans-2,3-dihydro-3-hydroxyanthranilate isomerase